MTTTEHDTDDDTNGGNFQSARADNFINPPYLPALDSSGKSTNADDIPVKGNENKNGVLDVEIEEAIERKAPEGRYGWIIVLASAVAHMIIGGLERSGGVLYLEFLDRYESSATTTAWVTSLASGFRLFCGPLSSALSRKFGFRLVVVVGSIFMAIGCVLSAFSPELFYVHLAFGVFGGIGRGLCYTPCVVIVGMYFDEKRGLAVGLATAGVGIGSFFLPPLLRYLFEEMGYKGTYIILGGICLQLCVCGMLFRSPKRKAPEYTAIDIGESRTNLDEAICSKSNQGNNKTKFDPDKEENNTEPLIKEEPKEITKEETECKSQRDKEIMLEKKPKKKRNFFGLTLLKDPLFLAFCVTIALMTMAFQIVLSFLPALAESKGLSKTESALLLSVMGVIDTVARIGSGFIFDLERVRPYRRYLYNAALLFIGLTTLLAPWAVSFSGFVMISLALGILAGAYISQKSVIVVDLLGKEALMASFGIVVLFQGVGTFIGPPLAGTFRDTYNNYDLAFLFGGAITLLATLILLASNVYFFCKDRRETRLAINKVNEEETSYG